MKTRVQFDLGEAARGKEKLGFEEASSFVFSQLFKMRKELRFDLMGGYPDVEWDEPTVKRKGNKIVLHVDGVFPPSMDAKGEGGEGYVEFEVTVK